MFEDGGRVMCFTYRFQDAEIGNPDKLRQKPGAILRMVRGTEHLTVMSSGSSKEYQLLSLCCDDARIVWLPKLVEGGRWDY